RLSEEHPGAPRPPGEPPMTNATMYAWRARTQTLEGMAAYYGREYTVSLNGEATRLHGVLFGVTPLDVTSHAAAAAVLIGVATVACLLPALRAASTNPAVALRGA